MMNRYLAVTTCNAQQWEQYGREMVRTFRLHYPAAVDLMLYSEGFTCTNASNLHAAAPWLVEFKRKYQPPSDRYNRKDYRRDAVRFAHKVAAIGAAAESADCDVLIWIDSDIRTFDEITMEWIDDLFPPSATVAWLDRTHSYPECSFLMFRMPEARKVIGEVVGMYTSGDIFRLPETHDSYVFQHVVSAAARRGKVKIHSLSGEARTCTGHPFVNSRLGEKMDHLKGDLRKAKGSSFARDLHRPRPEPYWDKVRATRAP